VEHLARQLQLNHICYPQLGALQTPPVNGKGIVCRPGFVMPHALTFDAIGLCHAAKDSSRESATAAQCYRTGDTRYGSRCWISWTCAYAAHRTAAYVVAGPQGVLRRASCVPSPFRSSVLLLCPLPSSDGRR
jgi:hypothetical protein